MTKYCLSIQTIAKACADNWGCIFIYSSSARLVSFEIYEFTPPPPPKLNFLSDFYYLKGHSTYTITSK